MIFYLRLRPNVSHEQMCSAVALRTAENKSLGPEITGSNPDGTVIFVA